MTSCQTIAPGATAYAGKQGFGYFEGIARETVGAQNICMHLLVVPPGGRTRPHKHAHHETAIYVLSGQAVTHWGERLEHRVVTGAGQMLYIPADVPHMAINSGPAPVRAVVARTDPHEQESVIMLPHLDRLVP